MFIFQGVMDEFTLFLLKETIGVSKNQIRSKKNHWRLATEKEKFVLFHVNDT